MAKKTHVNDYTKPVVCSKIKRVVGIDPSFSSTGLCCVEGDRLIDTAIVKASERIVYDISQSLQLAHNCATEIMEFVTKHKPEAVVIEYPILATRSGSYLGLIQQALFPLWGDYPVYMVPSQACKSIVRPKVKGKTPYVVYVQERFHKRFNHDIATSIILTEVFYRYQKGEYPNVFLELQKETQNG